MYFKLWSILVNLFALDKELKVVLKLTKSLTSYVCKSGSGGFKIDYTYLGFASAMRNSYNFSIGAIDG